MVDLASASCRVEFHSGAADLHTMAASSPAAFTTRLKPLVTATAPPGGNRRPTGSRSRRTRSRAVISLWETLEASPGRIRVRHQGLSGDFNRLSRVAEAIAHRDGVEACKAIPWSHRLTIDFRPDNGVADWFVDEAERTFEHLLASETQ